MAGWLGVVGAGDNGTKREYWRLGTDVLLGELVERGCVFFINFCVSQKRFYILDYSSLGMERQFLQARKSGFLLQGWLAALPLFDKFPTPFFFSFVFFSHVDRDLGMFYVSWEWPC